MKNIILVLIAVMAIILMGCPTPFGYYPNEEDRVAENETGESTPPQAVSVPFFMTRPLGSSDSYSIINYNSTPVNFAEDMEIIIESETDDASFYYSYSTDTLSPPTDPNPLNGSPFFSNPLELSGSGAALNIKAMGLKSLMYPSSIGSVVVTRNTDQASDPTFGLAEGTYPVNQSVTMTSSTAGAQIWYEMTSDGSEPSVPVPGSSTLYSSGISLSSAGTYIFRVIVSATSYNNSNVIRVQYNINPSYSVSYSGNGSTGGTVPTDSNAYLSGDSVTVLGNTGSLTRTGYTFVRWNTAADGSGTNYSAGNTFTMPSSNQTLYAQWILAPYTESINLGTQYIEGLIALDADGDGNSELALVSNRDGTTQQGYTEVYDYSGGTMDNPSWSSTLVTSYPYGGMSTDLNQDGNPDLLVVQNGLNFYQNTGGGSFNEIPLTLGGTTSPNDVLAVGHFDSDSLMDIIVGGLGSGSTPPIIYEASAAAANVYNQIAYLDPTGAVPNGDHSTYVMDINNDGLDDIADVELYSGQLRTFINQGNFTFTMNLVLSLGNSNRIYGFVPADFNGDGYDDFMINYGAGPSRFYLNDGAGNFTLVYATTNSGVAYENIALDFNADGYMDVISGEFSTGEIWFYKGHGDGNFSEGLCSYTASSIYGLAVADFDGNGTLDIAFGEDPLIILYNAVSSF